MALMMMTHTLQGFFLQRLKSTLQLMAGVAVSCLVLAMPAQAAGGGKASGSFETMVPLEPMPIPIIQQSRIRGILLVEIYLEAPDQQIAGEINHLMPRLRDSLRTGLSEFAAHEIRLDRPIDLDRLDRYISREAHTILHDKRTHVIFRQVMVQKK